MTDASTPVLREARPEDEAGIDACLTESFPDNPKARRELRHWQYHNPFGELCAWVYDDGGRIVGHYANYPVPCLLDGRVSVAGVASRRIGASLTTAPSSPARTTRVPAPRGSPRRSRARPTREPSDSG